MAKLGSGILGAVEGSFGQVVGYRRLGKCILQKSSGKSKVLNNASLKSSKETLILLNDFLSNSNRWFSRYFASWGISPTDAQRIFISSNLNGQFTKSGNNFFNFRMSVGNLPFELLTVTDIPPSINFSRYRNFTNRKLCFNAQSPRLVSKFIGGTLPSVFTQTSLNSNVIAQAQGGFAPSFAGDMVFFGCQMSIVSLGLVSDINFMVRTIPK